MATVMTWYSLQLQSARHFGHASAGGSNPKAVRDSLYEVSDNAANASAVKYCTFAPILEDIMYIDGV